MTKLNRLLSNLPFNPSLINQVGFYSKRLKQETSVRRIGFAFMALTFFVQLFAVVAPPQPSLAQDVNNDIIRGGFQTKDQAILMCIDPQRDFSTILAHYNISCDNLAAATTEVIQSTNDNRQIKSMGRLNYFSDDEAVNIGGGTYYMRYLWKWDKGTPSTYKALQGLSNSGQTFYILFNCGNLSLVGNPPTPPPPPPPTPTPEPFTDCSIMLINYDSGSKVKKGTEIVVRGQVTGGNLPAGATADLTYEYVNKTTGAAAGPSITTRGVPFQNGIAIDPANRSFTVKNDGAYEFRLVGTYQGQEIRGSRTGKCVSTIYVNTPDVCPEIPGDQTEESQCKPCEKAKDRDGIACLVMFKKAANVTTNTPDANGTTAKAGDVITYTLSTKNTGKATVKKYVVSENISDILDYADVIDYHGGTINDKNIVGWPAADIKAGATLEQKLTVKVKDPIPQTPVSSSNPGKFDLTMTNVYGTDVNIKLPPSIIKTTEQVTTTLPNTGPGANIIMGTVLVVVVGYFFARSRLLAKELDIVRTEYATGA